MIARFPHLLHPLPHSCLSNEGLDARSISSVLNVAAIQQPIKKRYQLEWLLESIPLQPAGELDHMRDLKHNALAHQTSLDVLTIDTIEKMLLDLWEWSAIVSATGTSRKEPQLKPRIGTLSSPVTLRTYATPTCPTSMSPSKLLKFTLIFSHCGRLSSRLCTRLCIMQAFYGPQNTVIPSC
ncbi:hypothetical protein K439DRAFT_1664577 [Ramaria rubella]|nr:hypothetical protein K439DRAFT_1664577 [Ramaria rubella]